MSEARNQIEAVHFKPVPSGFVFRAPNPWLFGTADHFLVNAAQKEALLDLLTRPGSIAKGLILAAWILAWAVGGSILVWAFGSGQDNPTARDLIVMTGLIVIGVVAALPIGLAWQRRRVNPVLAGLPRSNERITYREMKQGLVASTSPRALFINAGGMAIMAAAFGFIFLNKIHRHPAADDPAAWVFLTVSIVGAVVAVLQLGRGWIRARAQKRAD